MLKLLSRINTNIISPAERFLVFYHDQYIPMHTNIDPVLVILVLCIVLLLAYILYRVSNGIKALLKIGAAEIVGNALAAKKSGGSPAPKLRDNIAQYYGSAEDAICEKTNKFLKRFLTEQLTPDLVMEMETLADDISFDAAELTVAKLKKMDEKNIHTASSKIILDTMLHYYVHSKSPNNISEEVLKGNKEKLDIISERDKCYTKTSIADLVKITDEALKEKNVKTVSMSVAENFRRAEVRRLAAGSDEEKFKKLEDANSEISKLRVELRSCRDELARNLRTDKSSGVTNLLLEECNRERNLLRDKIYELRRDIESLRARAPDAGEILSLRARIDDLRARNAQLESQLARAERAHGNEMEQIIALQTELNNCKQLLEEVLQANEG